MIWIIPVVIVLFAGAGFVFIKHAGSGSGSGKQFSAIAFSRFSARKRKHRGNINVIRMIIPGKK
jgi:hypothetical protein